jgi:hypothetical protein
MSSEMSTLGSVLLSVSLALGQPQAVPQVLKQWTSFEELASFKKSSSREAGLGSGKAIHWQGILLSEVIEKATEELPLEQRARFDLLVLEGSRSKAYLPRSLIQKYPILLARTVDGREVPGGFQVVIPWTSRPKIRGEEYLPLESYFVSELKSVQLTSYQSVYAGNFLKRRTDPSAIRGEKIFLQNCMGCHGNGSVKQLTVAELTAEGARARVLASGKGAGHAMAPGVKQFDSKDRRAILSFLEAYRSENTTASK